MGVDSISELSQILPQIIIYIVTGYVFNKTFHFVSLKRNSTDVEHVLTSSLVIGYIYCNIAYLIPLSISYEADIFCIIFSALLLGYIFAKILQNKRIIKVFDFLKIRDTGNLYYWDDLMDNEYPMKVRILFENSIYEGMLHNYESYSNEPCITLASYVIKTLNNEVISDFSSDNTRVIILNNSKAISVEIIYCENGEICKDLLDLCNFNK